MEPFKIYPQDLVHPDDRAELDSFLGGLSEGDYIYLRGYREENEAGEEIIRLYDCHSMTPDEFVRYRDSGGVWGYDNLEAVTMPMEDATCLSL